MSVPADLRRLVIDRAENCCEYCKMPQQFDEATFQVDHIRAEKHRGATEEANLALACFPCNNHKGPNLTGIDPDTDEILVLFNPRTDVWEEHFTWDGARLNGLSAVGRATVEVLSINLPDRVRLRSELVNEGVFPPQGS